jgi:hypothetical protein
MHTFILGIAAIGSAAVITSAASAPSAAAPISPVVPLSAASETEAVTQVDYRRYQHKHCGFRYGELRCRSHGPVVRYHGGPSIHYGLKYRDDDGRRRWKDRDHGSDGKFRARDRHHDGDRRKRQSGDDDGGLRKQQSDE